MPCKHATPVTLDEELDAEICTACGAFRSCETGGNWRDCPAVVNWRAELIEALTEIVMACGISTTDDYGVTDRYDSGALSHVAAAMRRLVELGQFEIESEYGRRVIGRFVEAPK